MDRRQFTRLAGAATLAGLPGRAFADEVLDRVLAGDHRVPGDRERDIHRNPRETLIFFGLRPGMTVVEITPGTGYFDVLAPYAKATGGKYIGTGAPSAVMTAKMANAGLYGAPTFTGTPVGPTSGPLAPPGSVDMVVTFRNVHNWLWREGVAEKVFGDSAAALKSGGILGVVEHRADPRPETVRNGRRAADGYVATATVVELARQAGLRLDGQSEVNANPRDTKDHPFDVWTLPPTNRATAPLPADWNPEKYRQIGESDRMTLRFVKP